MKGPCLCGDVACPHCGSPGQMELEAAEEYLMDQLAAANLHAEEYRMVAEVGVAAVKACRKAIEERDRQLAEFAAECEDRKELDEISKEVQ